jgi:hypothetical protein
MLENLGLIELNLPALQELGDNFLSENRKLKKFYAPKLKITKWRFLAKNTELTDFVVANDDILHKYNKRLVMILAKNKIKKKLKNSVNRLIDTIAITHDTKS